MAQPLLKQLNRHHHPLKRDSRLFLWWMWEVGNFVSNNLTEPSD